MQPRLRSALKADLLEKAPETQAELRKELAGETAGHGEHGQEVDEDMEVSMGVPP